MCKIIYALVFLPVFISANAFFDPSKVFNLKSEFWGNDKLPVAKVAPFSDSLVEGTIMQRVDNFNPANGQTFEQHYVMSDEFFFADGPIFIFLSDAALLNGSALIDSMVVELARDLSGYMFTLEHRYSGQSYPVDDLSIENLEFFSVHQAIADIAHFINFIKTTKNGTENSPVILIGGGYGGSLGVWFRQQHPALALGAWASSSPMLAISNHYQFKEYSGVAYRSIGGAECYDNLEAGFREMEELVANGSASTLAEIFNLCEDFANEDDLALFFYSVAELYSIIPTFATPASINGVCALVGNVNLPSRVHAIATLFFNPLECISINYNELIETSRNTNIYESRGDRVNNYLGCLQIGWFHTSDSHDQPFGQSFTIDFFYKLCQDIFDESFTNATLRENVSRFNTAYGGLQPDVTNAIFTHGSMDPWRSIGIQESLNDFAPAIIIPNASSSNDLNAINDNDSDELLNVKLEIIEIVRNWIARYNGIDLTPY